ncbi:hypothetical protein BDZ89DRAFT_290509 [Hymenopellis radicata]|nr:hypothetical protein BDZ89DRAFT_290509 [Hymenopellis radicata]
MSQFDPPPCLQRSAQQRLLLLRWLLLRLELARASSLVGLCMRISALASCGRIRVPSWLNYHFGQDYAIRNKFAVLGMRSRSLRFYSGTILVYYQVGKQFTGRRKFSLKFS